MSRSSEKDIFGGFAEKYKNKKEPKEAQLKEELSKPASEPIKHNPEEEKTVSRFKFAQNRNKSTLDRVMETISNK